VAIFIVHPLIYKAKQAYGCTTPASLTSPLITSKPTDEFAWQFACS